MASIGALVLGALSAGPARAATPPALDQYVPSLPSADGQRLPVALLATPGSAAGLVPAVRARLARAPGGALLTRIASSPALGAPAARPATDARRRAQPDGDAGSALADALAGGPRRALLLGLVAIAAALAGTARFRARR